MAKTQVQKPVSTLNGLRAAVFGATFGLSVAFIVGGFLIGNAIAFELPYAVAAVALAVYLVRDFFGIGPVDALFSSDDVIRAKRAAR
ncbi:TPA: hypothetical protein ACW43T_004436 [Salmonella enterica subsp. enterica]